MYIYIDVCVYISNLHITDNGVILFAIKLLIGYTNIYTCIYIHIHIHI